MKDWGKKEDLTNFLSKVLNLGYIFQYVTTDIDYANVTAIHYSFGDAKVQFCLWHLKRAISNKTILQQDQANSRSYEFIKNYSWFDLYGDFLKKIYDYVLIENDVDLTTYETNIYLWLCQCGQQKFNLFFLCMHLLKKIMDGLGLQFIPQIGYTSQIRTTLPLVVSKWVNQNKTYSINLQPVNYNGLFHQQSDNTDHLNNFNQVEDYLNFESDEDSHDDGEEIMDPTYIPDEPNEDTIKRDEFMDDIFEIKAIVLQPESASDSLKDTQLKHPQVLLVIR